MPGAVLPPPSTEDSVTDKSDEVAERIALVLPSALDLEKRSAICQHRVAEYERQFRLAQIEDSLVELRHVRRIRRTLLVNHRTQIAGQGQRVNTRSRSVIDSVQERINKFTLRYRAARQALLKLDPTGKWKDSYLDLPDSENRGPGKECEEEGLGDGRWIPSWIWLANPQVRNSSSTTQGDEEATQEEVNDVMRVEWTTSLARMERWVEEVELLQEEMRRVVAFLEWKSIDWMKKREAQLGFVTSDIQSGLDAYAQKQAAVYRHLALSFSKLWHPTLFSYDLDHSWATTFLQRHGVPLPDLNAPTTSRDRGIFKLRVRSNAKSSQSNTVPTPPPKISKPSNVVLLDEADSDVSTDTTSGESDDESELSGYDSD